MGALHRGHETLLQEGRRLAGKRGLLVASIFVNPTQFGPGEDFSRYPRPLPDDLRSCRRTGVDAVFLPEAGDLYPAEASVWVDEDRLSAVLCGKSRPGHFRGVCTVVAKLLAVVRPDKLVLGEKDWQQLTILRRMVRELFFPVQVIGIPTVREADGLAMSSRNQYLDAEAREAAPGIYRALQQTAARVSAGERSAARLRRSLRRSLEKISGAGVDYAEIVDAETLHPSGRVESPCRALVAVRLGGTRLIDNIALLPPL